MSLRATSNDGLNILLVTPTGRDAELIENALSVANVQSEVLKDVAGELRQLFANLIGNAFDATRKGGCVFLRERIAIHPKTGQHGVRVTVADTGHGMSAEVKAHLFKAFKSTKGNNGSGLGLWISKGIIEKHCGSIQCRSSTEPKVHGTVLTIFIPPGTE